MIEPGTTVALTLPLNLCDADGENERRFEPGDRGVVVERLSGGGPGAALVVEMESGSGYRVTFEAPRDPDDEPYGYEALT